jgi:LytS/YehU family sensor histidine kinase
VGLVRINLLFTGISLAYWYGKRSIAIERNQQRLEKEISEAQLMLLKNQISPHFLYNTLSFLYTKALPLSKDLSDAIAKLSEMMRYSLTEIGKDDKVPVEKEITHLENFIEIHQLRFNRELNIKLVIEGDTTQHKIMPLLLITFVENAIKHGKVHDPEHPLLIKMKMEKGIFNFFIKNKKTNGLKEKSSGIGLRNIKSRLSLSYPDAHKLEIIESSEDYSVCLTINVRND